MGRLKERNSKMIKMMSAKIQKSLGISLFVKTTGFLFLNKFTSA
jgi:hypothetical protein